MAFKMKGTAMYDKTMVDGKSMMKLKKEFGGAMEMKTPMDMKSPMDAAKPDYIDIDGDGNKKESMKEAAAAMPMKSPMELEKEDSAMDMRSPMDMSPKKLTEDAAMKFKSMVKKGLVG